MLALKKDRGRHWQVLRFKPTVQADHDAGIAELAEDHRPLGRADLGARRSGELSHGQKQWLEIGMLLAQEPRLLAGG